MPQVKNGDKVRVHYTGRLDDGTQFDSSSGSDPLEFVFGAGEVIAGFEDAVLDMSPGDKETVTIPADKAYGPYREEMVLAAPRSEIPTELDPQVGQQLQLQLQNSGGEALPVVVTKVTDDTVTLDGNHPLAGKALTFDLELVEII